ncbi:MAG: aldo/keto reductase [Chloroflexi bacterium]|nr:aldo/keto reductase [Chloroflexota bacterium]
MRRVALGKTGLQVSRLGIGTDVLRDDPDGIERETEVLLSAWSLGVNLIDTDRWYRTYPAIARALPHMRRADLVLITKTYEKSVEGALNDVCYALDTIKCDYIDVFLLHAIDSVDQYAGLAGALEGLQTARERGWIHHIGLSSHAVPMVQEVSRYAEIEVVLAALNSAGKSMHKTGTRAEMEQGLERCHAAGQGVYIMKPFARGRLIDDEAKDEQLAADQVEPALAYLYALPFVDAVIPGMRTVQQVQQCAEIAERIG